MIPLITTHNNIIITLAQLESQDMSFCSKEHTFIANYYHYCFGLGPILQVYTHIQVPRDFQKKGSAFSYVKHAIVQLLSHFKLSMTPWTVACEGPLSMGFPRQEYWSVLPFPSPGDFPDPGIELGSLTLQVDSLPAKLDERNTRQESSAVTCKNMVKLE